MVKLEFVSTSGNQFFFNTKCILGALSQLKQSTRIKHKLFALVVKFIFSTLWVKVVCGLRKQFSLHPSLPNSTHPQPLGVYITFSLFQRHSPPPPPTLYIPMGNCSASTSDVDKTLQVKKGTLDPTCFEEHRALGQGGFGTVFAVTKK